MTADHEAERTEEVRPGLNRRWRGYACFTFGCLFAVATGLLLVEMFMSPDQFVPLLIAVFLLLALSLLLLFAAEGLFQPSASEVCRQDARKPVLFLRPFEEDRAATYDIVSSGETTTAVTARAEDFLLALNASGPLISIGKPDWSSRLGIYPHGVYRDYVDSGCWQARVTELLDRAGLVVLLVGATPGIEWEIAEVKKRIRPESLLLYLAPKPAGAFTRRGRENKEEKIYQRFRPIVERHFDIALPEFSSALHIIGFDADGRSVIASKDVPRRWFLTEYGRVSERVSRQLQEVLAQTQPHLDLGHYHLPGRGALWSRISVASGSFIAAVAFGLWSGEPLLWSQLLLASFPGFTLILGWVLIVRHYARRWLWVIPISLVLLSLLDLIVSGSHLYGIDHGLPISLMAHFGWIGWLLKLAYAACVLVLGLLIGGYDRRRGSSDFSG